MYGDQSTDEPCPGCADCGWGQVQHLWVRMLLIVLPELDARTGRHNRPLYGRQLGWGEDYFDL